jgi:hypothetical protein
MIMQIILSLFKGSKREARGSAGEVTRVSNEQNC